jgi:hypothetical protein
VNRWTVSFPLAINSELAAAAAGHQFVDPMAPLCTGTTCTYQDRGTYLFVDFGHYSAAGSDWAVRSLFVQPDLLGLSRAARDEAAMNR